ncbi:hypothetical protein DFH05DRAFT_1398235 [Lentinula detonsa]|uniref:CCDC174 alpha/beta GRSR domain-containing protein n=1 Tax=Lentinula detonsa TaxID=2804962 RepID=A0A9W8TXT0_9AGAR|nr:hypothetical protein DFH05DRAFT_1398235 [Lentinula detonsa]
MHSTKSRAKGISAGSLFDLKADLAKKGEEFARDKAAGKTYTLATERPANEKKSSKWSLSNKGVQARAARDVRELESVSQPTLENARISLERKSKKYTQLIQGKTAGLNEKQMEALLVDFDAKGIDSNWESDSDDVDESLTVPTHDGDDPMVEYIDEYGRTRTARKSEVPRQAKLDEEIQEDDDERYPSVTISFKYGLLLSFSAGNPQVLQNHFPTFHLDEDRRTQIVNEYAEENNPLDKHYDPNSEVRDRGAASYSFSLDEQTRQARLDDLKATHLETNATRKEMGAVDVRPGEIEGMQAPEVGSSAKGSEKRKREIEERRKILEAKRKKAKTTTEGPKPGSDSTSTASITANAKQSPIADPFASLESATFSTPSPNNGKSKAISSDADEFLAQLGNEMLDKKRK